MKRLEEVRKLIAQHRSTMTALVDAAEAETRSLTTEETTQFTELRSAVETLKAEEAVLVDAEEARKALEESSKRAGLPPTVRLGAEPSVYRKDERSYGFLSDVVLAQTGNPEARERLARYQEEQRAISTTVGSGGSYVPPAYLEQDAIDFRRFARVTADLVAQRPLPDGTMTINIPKMATGTAVATQSTQNSAVTETDFTDEFVSANVITLAGQQTVSVQFIDRSPLPVEDMVFADLKNACDQQVDLAVISALSTNGTAVAYTSTTPTAAAVIPIIGQAKADVATGSAKKPSNAIIMTPARWEWMVATGVDSTGRPLVVPNGQMFNAFGEFAGDKIGPVPSGSVLGVPVYTDGNIPSDLGSATDQDEIFVLHRQSHWLMEGPTMVRALPQTLGGNLSVLLQVYRYVAIFANRFPDATAVVGGTGLVTPVF